MSFKFACPNCNESIPADPTLAGESTNCPKCDWIIRIPKMDVLNESREQIKFLCPSCDRKLSATVEQFGTEMPCPYNDCKNPILVPRPEWSAVPTSITTKGEVRPSSLISAAEELTRRSADTRAIPPR